MDDFFAPPAFKPADALLQLKRSLRDLKPLAERGEGFELQGMRVIELSSDASTITVRLARRQSRTPEWDRLVLKNSADVRKCIDEARRRLARWTEE
ncbi:hypothetical protein [Piscinibacter sp. XHJ-5]|uniref:hypothetical protein n=1 Tax=Piscinibacter sp. XHJ-5 TaxID=3037797 RepID=UPI00245320D1|nr:hypothetical protein [Piscinibacter sp. XHJ-5]